MADEQNQQQGAQLLNQNNSFDIRAEKPAFNEKGEVVTTRDQKIDVSGGKIVPQAGSTNDSNNAKSEVSEKSDSLKDPIERMKEGVSKNMPAVKKTVFDKIKSVFVINAGASKAAVDKVDQAEITKAETGESVKITPEERQKYMEAEKLYQDGLASVKDLIAPSSMEINYDSIRLDGMYARTFYVYAYPRYLNVNWLAPVINFDVTMDVAQFIYPIESAQIMNTLKKKVAQMRSSMSIMAEKGQVSDPGLETALDDAETLRRDIQKGKEKFFTIPNHSRR